MKRRRRSIFGNENGGDQYQADAEADTDEITGQDAMPGAAIEDDLTKNSGYGRECCTPVWHLADAVLQKHGK